MVEATRQAVTLSAPARTLFSSDVNSTAVTILRYRSVCTAEGVPAEGGTSTVGRKNTSGCCRAMSLARSCSTMSPYTHFSICSGTLFSTLCRRCIGVDRGSSHTAASSAAAGASAPAFHCWMAALTRRYSGACGGLAEQEWRFACQLPRAGAPSDTRNACAGCVRVSLRRRFGKKCGKQATGMCRTSR